MVELKDFPSAFRLDAFHKLNPPREHLSVLKNASVSPHQKSDVITESQILGEKKKKQESQDKTGSWN